MFFFYCVRVSIDTNKYVLHYQGHIFTMLTAKKKHVFNFKQKIQKKSLNFFFILLALYYTYYMV